MMRMTAIVPSAGRSERMKVKWEKPYLLLGRRPILAHTLLALERSPWIQGIILLARRSRMSLTRRLVKHFGFKKVLGIYAGGSNRFETVWRGLQRVPTSSDFVLVHDGVRPLLSEALIERVAKAARRYGAAIPVLPIHATVKRGRGCFVRETLIRKELWEVQTPQIFRRSLLLEGYRKAKKRGMVTTDCAALVERLGKKVRLVPGDPQNLKITTPEEFTFATLLWTGKEAKLCAWA